MNYCPILFLIEFFCGFEQVGASPYDKFESPKKFLKNLSFAERRRVLLETDKLIHDNWKLVAEKQGRLLGNFTTMNNELCALACTSVADCHFIDVKRIKNDYQCYMYTEYGVTTEVSSESGCAKLDSLKGMEATLLKWDADVKRESKTVS